MLLGEEEEGDGVLDVFEGVGFLQHEEEEPMVQGARRTLRDDRLYLDTCSSFHMCFSKKYLGEVDKVLVQLRGECNAGTTKSLSLIHI